VRSFASFRISPSCAIVPSHVHLFRVMYPSCMRPGAGGEDQDSGIVVLECKIEG